MRALKVANCNYWSGHGENLKKNFGHCWLLFYQNSKSNLLSSNSISRPLPRCVAAADLSAPRACSTQPLHPQAAAARKVLHPTDAAGQHAKRGGATAGGRGVQQPCYCGRGAQHVPVAAPRAKKKGLKVEFRGYEG